MRRWGLTRRLSQSGACALTFDNRNPVRRGDDGAMHRWEQEHGAAGAAGPVARVMYASQALVTGSVYAEMERIRASALKHNEPAGVATALLYQSGWFVQWKEGPGEAVERIMERVAGDARHYDLRVVHRSRGPRLLCGPWSMAIVQCREQPADMELRVRELQRQAAAGRRFAPPAIWRRLSTPMQHPGAARQEDPEAFQRVLACSAVGSGAFDLVNWLAEQRAEEVVHRRFAGAHALDVGTNYVDLEQDERVWRVIAMARSGLDVPLTRAFLPDYSHLVLLLSSDADRNVQLMERVLRACASLPQPPGLMGVADLPEAHRVPMALARRFGLQYLPAVADPLDPEDTWHAAEPLLGRWQHAAQSA